MNVSWDMIVIVMLHVSTRLVRMFAYVKLVIVEMGKPANGIEVGYFFTQ